MRVDSGLAEGSEVGGGYDPMLAKVIAHGPDRPAALRRLDRRWPRTRCSGVRTNVGFLRALLADPDVRPAAWTPGWPSGSRPAAVLRRRTALPSTAPRAEPVPDEVLAAAALDCALDLETAGPGRGRSRTAGGPAGRAWTPLAGRPAARSRYAAGRTPREVAVGDGDPVPRAPARRGRRRAGGHLDGARSRCTRAAERPDGALWLGRDGHAWALREQAAAQPPARPGRGRRRAPVRSPMPGTVQAVEVAGGRRPWRPASGCVVVEAMKMEHTVAAPVAGIGRRAAACGPVRWSRLDEVLAVVVRGRAADSSAEPADGQGSSSDRCLHR